MTTVSRTTSYTATTFSGTVELHFDPADPFAVELTFDESLTWRFARSVLVDGVSAAFGRPAGAGDVKTWAEGNWYYLLLNNDRDSAVLRVVAAQVLAFLADAERLAPSGRERLDFDAELDQLLRDGAR